MKKILIISLFLSSFIAYAKTHNIEIKKFKFIPQEITIESGDTVIWTNKEKRQYHSVWFKDLGEKESDYFFPDETFERKFDNIGDFAYECGPHPKMKGLVNVVKKN